MQKENEYKVVHIPAMRRFAIDAGILGRRRHFVHGLLELDVTGARRAIRAHKAATTARTFQLFWPGNEPIDLHPVH